MESKIIRFFSLLLLLVVVRRTVGAVRLDVDPAASNIVFAMHFVEGTRWSGTAIREQTAATLEVPAERLVFSGTNVIRVPVAMERAADGRPPATNSSDAVPLRVVVTFRATQAPTADDPSLLVLNTRAIERVDELFAAFGQSQLVSYAAATGIVPYPWEESVAEGTSEYSKEKLGFMGVLLGVFVLSAAGLGYGWRATQRGGDADLKAMLHKREARRTRELPPERSAALHGSPRLGGPAVGVDATLAESSPMIPLHGIEQASSTHFGSPPPRMPSAAATTAPQQYDEPGSPILPVAGGRSTGGIRRSVSFAAVASPGSIQ